MTRRNAFDMRGDIAQSGNDKPHATPGARCKIIYRALAECALCIGMTHITHRGHHIAVFDFDISDTDGLKKDIGCKH